MVRKTITTLLLAASLSTLLFGDAKVPEEKSKAVELPAAKESEPKFSNPFLKKDAPTTEVAPEEKLDHTPSFRSAPQTPPTTRPYKIEKTQEKSKQATSEEKAPLPIESPYTPPKLSVEKSKSPEVKKEGYILNYSNIALKELLRFVGEISNTNFVFHEEDLTSGGNPLRVSIVSEEPSSVEEIMTILLQILQSNGLSLSDQGDNIIIFRSASPNKLARIVTSDQENDGRIPQITRIFTLSNAYAPQISSIIKSLISKEALLEVSPSTNQIILTDLSQNVKRVEELINALDRPQTGLEVGKYVATTIPATELVTTAEKVIIPLSNGKPVVLVPHNTSDSIFIVSTPTMITKAINILSAIDVGTSLSSGIHSETTSRERSLTATEISKLTPKEIEALKSKGDLSPEEIKALDEVESIEEEGKSPEAAFKVYKLRHHKGNTIAASLNEIGNSLGTSGIGGEGLVQAISSMRWLPSSNSLIITGTPESVNKVHNLIATLDSPLRQVFIEMLILETSVQKSFSFGVEWGAQAQSAGSGRVLGSAGQGFGTSGVQGVQNLISNRTVTDLPAGLGLGVIGDVLVHNGQPILTMGAMINALENDTETTILMNPRIITQDAKSAEIFVGENIPYKSATIQPNIGEATTEFEYRNVGTRLVVTPYLGNSDLVTLEISQDISEVADQDTNDQTLLFQNTPKSRTTSTQTTVHVPDGNFLMISGMIRSAQVKGRLGVPCLGGLPVAGAAFSSRSYTKQKSNVIIFIRPRIISNEETMARITKQQNELFDEQVEIKPFEQEKKEFLDILDIYDY